MVEGAEGSSLAPILRAAEHQHRNVSGARSAPEHLEQDPAVEIREGRAQDDRLRCDRAGHPEVLPEHLLLALIAQRDGIVPALLAKMGVSESALGPDLEALVGKLPSVQGGAQPGLRPNVAGDFSSREPGTYTVQVYNYSDAAIDYEVSLQAR